ncbi:MAG TPA: hypothetical protein VFE07_15930 [Marmoricola sp.]|nr:hypothetical protein [Marmoricola sp.]
MSLPPGPPPSPDSYEAVGPEPMKRPVVDITIDWSQLPGAATALGVSLVSAAVVLSAGYSRESGDLDASNFVVGVLGTLGLLGVAVAGHLLAPAAERRGALISWTGATGSVGAGLMLGVLINKDPASTYVAAAVILALSASGYLVTRSAPFVLSFLIGATVLYVQVFDDLIDTGGGHGENTFMIIGAGVTVFVVLVTAAGWLLPATRVMSSVVVGAGGLIFLTGLLVALFFSRTFVASMSFHGGDDPSRFVEGSPHDPFKNDVYMVLVYCAVLALLWLGCSLVTGHVAFRVLVLAAAVVIIPVASVAVFARHPTWWEVVAGGLGAAALAFGGWLSTPRPATP